MDTKELLINNSFYSITKMDYIEIQQKTEPNISQP